MTPEAIETRPANIVDLNLRLSPESPRINYVLTSCSNRAENLRSQLEDFNNTFREMEEENSLYKIRPDQLRANLREGLKEVENIQTVAQTVAGNREGDRLLNRYLRRQTYKLYRKYEKVEEGLSVETNGILRGKKQEVQSILERADWIRNLRATFNLTERGIAA